MILQKRWQNKQARSRDGAITASAVFILRLAIVLFSALLLYAMNADVVMAEDVPLGIDGHVYDADTLVPVPSWTIIDIINTDTSEVLSGTVGQGEPGRYSAALNWPLNTNITVRAGNPAHVVERNTTLSGIIHDFDLLLNMTLSSLPPNISSTPVTSALQHEQYTYAIQAYDWNNDALTYSLDVYPDGMAFAYGTTIEWTPLGGQAGDHDVTINVTDGTFTTPQSFTINVQNNNLPPVLLNDSITVPSGTTEFSTQLTASDPDGDQATFELVEAPSGFAITQNGSITYTVTGDLPRNETAIIMVTDGTDETVSSLDIVLLGSTTAPSSRNGGNSGGGGGVFPLRSRNDSTNNNTGLGMVDGTGGVGNGVDDGGGTSVIVPGLSEQLLGTPHDNPTIARVRMPNVIVIHLVEEGGRPLAGATTIVVEDAEGNVLKKVVLDLDPDDTLSRFSIVVYDVEGKNLTLKTATKHYSGSAQTIAGPMSEVTLTVEKTDDLLLLADIYMIERFGWNLGATIIGLCISTLVAVGAIWYVIRASRASKRPPRQGSDGPSEQNGSSENGGGP